ncbi:MAG: ABC transporter permease [Candidatus Izemoplasmataceae bacterium]
MSNLPILAMFFRFKIGDYFETFIDFLTDNLGWLFDGISAIVEGMIDAFEVALAFPPAIVLIVIITGLAWLAAGKKPGLAIGTFLGLFLIDAVDLWQEATETLALILVASFIALLIGIPTGIYASRNKIVSENIIRPVLDFMQTMPAFVYLIPAVIFFGLGTVAGAIATIIFSMPPVVRLTNLGIRQVPAEVVEAGKSLGSTPRQLLLKVQLPIALPTILAGVNQTILLALSMVVIASMIGAGGLGNPVLEGIQSLAIGEGFEGGIAVVVLAMILDRITQALGESTSK